VLQNKRKSSAIVPAGSFDPRDFTIVHENVNDYENNQTRFIVLTAQQDFDPIVQPAKTSLVVRDDNDHPGMLSSILTSFSNRDINLLSIISRPTRKEFGKYNFFIDINGHANDIEVSEAIREIGRSNKVKVLGSYPVENGIKL